MQAALQGPTLLIRLHWCCRHPVLSPKVLTLSMVLQLLPILNGSQPMAPLFCMPVLIKDNRGGLDNVLDDTWHCNYCREVCAMPAAQPPSCTESLACLPE